MKFSPCSSFEMQIYYMLETAEVRKKRSVPKSKYITPQGWRKKVSYKCFLSWRHWGKNKRYLLAVDGTVPIKKFDNFILIF